MEKCVNKNGDSSLPEYFIWSAMKDRCYNDKCNRWSTHGARGIVVCDRWRNSFKNFYADMGPRIDPKLSLERIDNDGPYSPENCKWATDREQAENRRTTHRITLNGKTQSLKAWCRDFGVPYVRTWKRVFKLKWEIERALKP